MMKDNLIKVVKDYRGVFNNPINSYSDKVYFKNCIKGRVHANDEKWSNLYEIQYDLTEKIKKQEREKEVTLAISFPILIFFVGVCMSIIVSKVIPSNDNIALLDLILGLIVCVIVALLYAWIVIRRTKKLAKNMNNNIDFYQNIKDVIDELIEEEQNDSNN